MKTRGLALALAWGVALGVNPVQAETPVPIEINPSARAIAKDLGFDEAEVEQVEEGKVITKQLGEEGKKELAAILFALVPISVDKAIERFRASDFEVDATILDWGSIDVPARKENFAKLTLPADELKKLAGDDVEDDFNFSAAELALLANRKKAAAEGPDRNQAALAALREIALARATAYQTRGIDGIAPYQHGKRQSLPAQDLRDALKGGSGVIQREDPAFYEWLRGYPNQGKASSSRFVWLVQSLNGRPAVILAHRAEAGDENAHFIFQRDFYVSHTFDALQVVGGVAPAGEGYSALFYTNRTYTEQVTGFGSAAAHGIGRRIMTGEIRALFDSFVHSL